MRNPSIGQRVTSSRQLDFRRVVSRNLAGLTTRAASLFPDGLTAFRLDSKEEPTGAAGYGWNRFSGDLAGALMAALVSLPYGLAISSMMGLPAILCLFSSIVTAPLIAALGRSPVLIGGASIVTAPFIAAAARAHGVRGAATLSILASIFMIGFRALRLGRHVTKVPSAVISGFSCGIGVMMLISQLCPLLPPAAELRQAAANIGASQWCPFVLGLAVIATAGIAARFSRRAPGPLLGVVVATAIARAAGVHENEIGSFTVATPPFVGFSLSADDVLVLLPSAFLLAVVTSVNTLMTFRVIGQSIGHREPATASDADLELGAYGIANFCAAMFGAPPSVGTPARSLAVIRCGGTTRLANLLHAPILAALLWFGSGAICRVPIPALAGVTAWMGLSLLDWSTLRKLQEMNAVDAAAFLATMLSVLFANAAFAVVVGCSIYAIRSGLRLAAGFQRTDHGRIEQT